MADKYDKKQKQSIADKINFKGKRKAKQRQKQREKMIDQIAKKLGIK